MRDFDDIYQQVFNRFGNKRAIAELMPTHLNSAALEAQDDNFYLSTLSRRVFRAGLKHALVDAKWPAFESAFFGFSPLRVAMMSDDELDELMANRAIIRHWNKIKSVRVNATLFTELIDEYGSIGRWLSQWPVEDITGLWLLLKNRGAQMGGNSAASFLRMAGKDSFVLSNDVVVALMAQGIVDKKPASQRDLKAVQLAFNRWREQSDWPLSHLSRLLALTVNH